MTWKCCTIAAVGTGQIKCRYARVNVCHLSAANNHCYQTAESRRACPRVCLVPGEVPQGRGRLQAQSGPQQARPLRQVCVCVCVYVRFGGYIYMAITTAVMSSPMKDVTWLHAGHLRSL